jgi:hypothetical protein
MDMVMVAVLHYASEMSEVLPFVILPGACAAARKWSRAAPRRGEYGNGITALGLGGYVNVGAIGCSALESSQISWASH